jgi:hypothetical protein
MRSHSPGRAWCIACAAALALMPSVLAGRAEVEPLFTASDVRTIEKPADRATGTARLGRVAQDVLENERLRLDLPDGRRYVARRAAPRSRDDVWAGSIDAVDGAAVWLSSFPGGLVGVLHVGAETYEIAPIWTGEVLLYGVGAEGRPPYADLTSQVDGSDTPGGTKMSWPTPDRASRAIIAWYTPAVQSYWAEYGGIEARLVTSTEALRGADGTTWVLEGIRQVDYVESGDARDALRWLHDSVATGDTLAPVGMAPSTSRVLVLITADNNLCGVRMRPRSLRARGVELHVINASCLTDPSLAAQLGGVGGAGRQVFADGARPQ